jgi:hypothetical protein
MSEPESTPGVDRGAVPCPACSRPSTSIKRYSLMFRLLFLGVGYRIWRGRYVACPACMRKALLKCAFAPMGILTANLMWPLAVLPYTLIMLGASTIPGHSREGG